MRRGATPRRRRRAGGPTRGKAPNPARYVEKFLDLAKPDPAAPGAFDALAAAVEFGDTAWDWKDESVSPDAAVDLLAAHHVENPRLAETFRYVKDSDSQASRNLMREAAKRNPDRSVRGQALFFLATGLTGQAELIELFRESPSFKEGLRKSHGEDWVARRSSADPKDPRDQARELFERAAKEFADVKVDDKTVGALARQALFQLDHLQVGQAAPEIVGKDADGVEMRLSDHRGKVVELVFWGGWCGSCMASVPEERNLVDKMRGRPFVLLGVNSDPPDRVNGIVREKRINWCSGPMERGTASSRSQGPGTSTSGPRSTCSTPPASSATTNSRMPGRTRWNAPWTLS